jgi:hypothetical protein
MAGLTRTALRRAAAATVATTLLALTGCSGDGGDNGDNGDPTTGDQSSASPSGPPPLPTHTTMGVVSGKLSDETRARIKAKITTVVDDWFDAAYVGGDWPRSEIGTAYPHFSGRAAQDAERDAGLMSNARIADRVDSVEATKRRLRIDVLAVKRRAVGVTARFVLAMKLAGEVNRAERVAGSLFLTWRDGGWQVFGYDVQRGKA